MKYPAVNNNMTSFLLISFIVCSFVNSFHTRHQYRHAMFQQVKLSKLASHMSANTLDAEERRTSMYNLNANEYWKWRGQKIRYVSQGIQENEFGPTVLLVHGLFVNADHFRKQMDDLANNGCRVFAIDLLGNGYSSKPYPTSDEAILISGERDRPNVIRGVTLGTANGNIRNDIDVQLSHPVKNSVYNFFTWAEQLTDFVEQVAKPGDSKTILVCNSIGTISSLQASIDRPDIFDACYIINPNFRELHVAESPKFLQPIVKVVQSWLRSNGQGIFDTLAKPNTVKNILQEPYHVSNTVTDELVDVLLSPLLREGSADVVFDTLSYSAGPLPEQQLQSEALRNTIVEICYGVEDPWTPPLRVQGLERYDPVKAVIPLENVGHCPHDEAPELVNPLIIDFVNRVVESRSMNSKAGTIIKDSNVNN